MKKCQNAKKMRRQQTCRKKQQKHKKCKCLKLQKLKLIKKYTKKRKNAVQYMKKKTSTKPKNKHHTKYATLLKQAIP